MRPDPMQVKMAYGGGLNALALSSQLGLGAGIGMAGGTGMSLSTGLGMSPELLQLGGIGASQGIGFDGAGVLSRSVRGRSASGCLPSSLVILFTHSLTSCFPLLSHLVRLALVPSVSTILFPTSSLPHTPPPPPPPPRLQRGGDCSSGM